MGLCFWKHIEAQQPAEHTAPRLWHVFATMPGPYYSNMKIIEHLTYKLHSFGFRNYVFFLFLTKKHVFRVFQRIFRFL